MIDDKTKTALDGNLISMNEPYEIRDRCKRLGRSKEAQTTAVKTVGNSADKVRTFLQRQPH